MTDTFNLDADESSEDNTSETTSSAPSFEGEPGIGTFVTYVSGKGKFKPALVLGTSESVTEGTSLKKPEPGHLYLNVYSPAGSVEYKKRVPHASLVEDTVRVWQ